MEFMGGCSDCLLPLKVLSEVVLWIKTLALAFLFTKRSSDWARFRMLELCWIDIRRFELLFSLKFILLNLGPP